MFAGLLLLYLMLYLKIIPALSGMPLPIPEVIYRSLGSEKLLFRCWKPPLIFNLNNLTFALLPPQGSTGILSGRAEKPFEVADWGHIEAAEVPMAVLSRTLSFLLAVVCAD